MRRDYLLRFLGKLCLLLVFLIGAHVLIEVTYTQNAFDGMPGEVQGDGSFLVNMRALRSNEAEDHTTGKEKVQASSAKTVTDILKPSKHGITKGKPAISAKPQNPSKKRLHQSVFEVVKLSNGAAYDANRDTSIAEHKNYHGYRDLQTDGQPKYPGSPKPSVNETGLGYEALEIPEENYFKAQNTVVSTFDFQYIIPENTLCSNDSEGTFILVLICSLHENFRYRQAIRDTWGSITKYQRRVKIVFLVGRHKDPYWDRNIGKESNMFHDIIQVNFMESYKNLTLKVLSGFQWAMRFCREAQYILKCDEDMIVNVPYLAKLLIQKPLTLEMMGSVNSRAPVMRLARSKWGVSVSVYPYRYYPPYLSGNSYVVPLQVVDIIINTARHVPMIPIEDAYITGILARIANITLRGSELFTYWGSPVIQPCDFVEEKKVSGTHMTPELMYRLWGHIAKGKC